MVDIDNDWMDFLQNDNNDCNFELEDNDVEVSSSSNINSRMINNINNIPKCSDIYISTKTKISYLNYNNIDIKSCFWKIPILKYTDPKNGVVKKQIKFSSTSCEEVEYILNKLKDIPYYEEQILEHIDNPEGRINFKDQRKVSIGICKKELLSYRSKQKRAFFNCFVLIFRILCNGQYKEMHVKVFNTGKLEIPGVQSDNELIKVLDELIYVLKPVLGENVDYNIDKTETVLINSNFNCGYYINRDKLHDVLKYKYRINSNFDACSYPGIQCKFYYDKTKTTDNQDGQQPKHNDYYKVSFMIFRTGSVLVVGRCEEDTLYHIYNFLKKILETEWQTIISSQANNTLSTIDNTSQPSKLKKNKIRKKILLFDSSS